MHNDLNLASTAKLALLIHASSIQLTNLRSQDNSPKLVLSISHLTVLLLKWHAKALQKRKECVSPCETSVIEVAANWGIVNIYIYIVNCYVFHMFPATLGSPCASKWVEYLRVMHFMYWISDWIRFICMSYRFYMDLVLSCFLQSCIHALSLSLAV